ncbi:hypothetical protein BcepSauron_254 [Burkholderia phage BcepSauron]|uniref:GIY-YIG domain-containing protein n=1 Tax=Burkholderia phage BcepSauron TaxID=2530033 RepID=A0A482MLH0_9CAUD|nr:hypothetical protein H1O17_gp254 [Burkholderia phage BcepSauron]QBQ74634.1 hypothetical protein BcepSauron_254 [Burkholderia phage BcepSauron]
MNFYVYQLRRADQSLPFYVGKGKDDRAWDHTRPYNLRKDKSFKANVIRAAHREGVEIVVEIVHTNLTSVAAIDLEEYWIDFYGRRDTGTGCLANLTDGREGTSGFKWSEEAKAKLMEALAVANNTREARAAKSKALLGKKRVAELKPRKKKPLSGKPDRMTPQGRARQLESIVGKPLSEETKTKLRVVCAGEKAYNASFTAQQVMEIRAEHAKGEKSATQLAKDYGVSLSAMGKLINRQTYKEVP